MRTAFKTWSVRRSRFGLRFRFPRLRICPWELVGGFAVRRNLRAMGVGAMGGVNGVASSAGGSKVVRVRFVAGF